MSDATRNLEFDPIVRLTEVEKVRRKLGLPSLIDDFYFWLECEKVRSELYKTARYVIHHTIFGSGQLFSLQAYLTHPGVEPPEELVQFMARHRGDSSLIPVLIDMSLAWACRKTWYKFRRTHCDVDEYPKSWCTDLVARWVVVRLEEARGLPTVERSEAPRGRFMDYAQLEYLLMTPSVQKRMDTVEWMVYSYLGAWDRLYYKADSGFRIARTALQPIGKFIIPTLYELEDLDKIDS